MSEFNDIIKSKKPTLVDFYATWCGPCKMQSPIIDQVKNVVGDEATILKIDVDANPELAQRYNVRSIPTLIIFVEGEAAWRGYGVHQADQLVAKINEFQKLKSDIGK
ncbi:MAG: thioredoxin [Paramuribaculum sp.]|nr:thioredoxin [Paramuribaculum sp.]